MKVSEPRQIEVNFNSNGVQYHEYECAKCGKTARNTYSEPSRSNMLERRLCWDCNYWHDFEKKLANKHTEMTIIEGHVYTPGNRTSGRMRGMAGRRFDIEYVEPSIYAGQRITTFDLWSGSQLPPNLAEQFPDTARFLGDGKKVEMDGEIKRCWNPSSSTAEPYQLPSALSRRTASKGE